ncbi:MAG: 2-C-methyl-D-erythritol 2,4-cyclodiphosphate synthase [Candidatus Latescibacterota bacterium]|nr:MAG: 2-C-methyl-D-erythritol 2,4-cyclodiphosphate synthase [Candidatus Latescibacterota bacterium]
MRVGIGYDAHRLVEGRKLILGGVEVPFEKGLEGHSDADVLCHAIMDAILGAAGLGDIGQMFPDDDPAFKGVSSLGLLYTLVEYCRKRRDIRIVNVDATVVAQRPKLAPYVLQMRALLAKAIGIPAERVSVKATTTEGMGFTGAGEGMAAYAVVMIEETPKEPEGVEGNGRKPR